MNAQKSGDTLMYIHRGFNTRAGIRSFGIARKCCSILLICAASVFAFVDTSRKNPSLQPAPEESFSIVVIPDTQEYHGRGTRLTPNSTEKVTNRIFENHVSWILKNLQDQRVVFVSHVGDIVDRSNDNEWAVARGCLDRLHEKVPYGVCPGNHDMKTNGDSILFQKSFGQERFTGFQWYGGCFRGDSEHPGHSGNNADSFQLVSAGGVDFVILHLECNAPDNVLKWGDKVFKKYSDRIAIVTTHMYLGPLNKPANNRDKLYAPKGVMRWKKTHGPRGNTPQQMWEKCFRKHPNLRLIFCGDQSGSQAMHLQQTGQHGNVVHSLLSDYRTGPLRIYRFLPVTNKMKIITFDTTQKKLVEGTKLIPEKKNHQFVLRLNLRGKSHKATTTPSIQNQE